MESSLNILLNELDQAENPELSEDKIVRCLNNGKISDDEKRKIVKRIQGPLSLATCHLIYAVVRHLFDERPGKIYCWKKDEIDFAQIKENLEEDDKAEGEHLHLKQCLRGCFYHKGVASEKDPKKAFSFYQGAAVQKYTRAQNNLGTCYEKGRGVERNDKKAVEYYQQAAVQKYARAQFNLGYCYRYGIGVKKSKEKAVEYYQQAADQGFPAAQANLGYCYQYGRGVERNDKKAVEYYQQAADQGFPAAQTNLGTCYKKGYCVAQDFVKAHDWYSCAAAQGDARATSFLKALYLNRAHLGLFLLSADLLATVKRLGGIHELSRFLLDQLHEIPLTEKKAIETRRSIGLYVHLKDYLNCLSGSGGDSATTLEKLCSLLKEDPSLFYKHFMENKADYLNRTDFDEELMSRVLQAARAVSPDQLYPQLCVQMGLYWEGKQNIEQAELYYNQIKLTDQLDQASQEAAGFWYFSAWSKWYLLRIKEEHSSVPSCYENLARKKATVFLLSSVLSKQPEGQAVDQESKQEGSVVQALDSEEEFLMEKLLKSNIVQPLSVLLGLEEIFISPNSYVSCLLPTIEYIKSAPGNTLEDKVTSYFDELVTPSDAGLPGETPVTPSEKTLATSNVFAWLLSPLPSCFTSLFSGGDKSKEKITISPEDSQLPTLSFDDYEKIKKVVLKVVSEEDPKDGKTLNQKETTISVSV